MENNNYITDKEIGISTKWFLKPFIGIVISGIASLPFLALFLFSLSRGNSNMYIYIVAFYLVIPLFTLSFGLLYNYLARANFHYSLEPNFLVLHQGIITRQQRNIPWAVIQHVIVQQDISDRILGLSTLAVENAVQDMTAAYVNTQSQRNNSVQPIGFSGNRVTIPGLLTADIGKLKQLVLEHMQANINHPNSGGL